MINTYSLRIGNIVQYDDGTEVQVCGIKQLDILVSSFSQYTSVNCFSGIELSPYWLERLGFKKDNSSQYGGYLIPIGEGEFLRLVYDESAGWHWPMHGYRRPKTDFVHQVQNLIFALTGEELITGEKEGEV